MMHTWRPSWRPPQLTGMWAIRHSSNPGERRVRKACWRFRPGVLDVGPANTELNSFASARTLLQTGWILNCLPGRWCHGWHRAWAQRRRHHPL